jgi:AAA+ superfamily predicted ATPase
MNPDLLFHLRALTRFIYYVTEEEDTFLTKLAEALKKYQDQTYVFNAAFGLRPLNQLIADWSSRGHQSNRECSDIHQSLIKIYQDDPRDGQNFYVITDPERYLPDPQVQRRVLNVAHQLHADDRTIKIIIFVGNRLVIPQKLQRYIEVVHDRGLTPEEIGGLLNKVCGKLEINPPKNIVRAFKGLTSFEADAAIAQSIIATKYDANNPKRIDAKVVGDFKRRQLAKTDLINFVDVDQFTFDVVGGNDHFKAWANKTKAAWTDEGQKFGLIPPKGVLAVGVWGCGKSLSVKAMGHAWNMPVVQLEMGKLRSSAVGESEANVYRAISLIESVAPCVVWMDEAEKSLSGGQSSAMSDAGTTSRTIGILSNWLQETEAQVCVAMTANSLKTLPVEFVNRMDERFFFDLPSEDERVAILKIHLVKRGQEEAAKNFNLANLAEHAVNMVGREIEQAIGAALIDSFEAGHDALDEDILATQLKGKPRIFKTMVDELKEVLDWVGYDPDVDDGIRARFASARRSETFKKFRGSGSGS